MRSASITGSVLCAALFLLPPSTAAASISWSEPVRVSSNITGQVDWFPSVAADNYGNVHIVWNLTSYDDDKGHNATDPEAIGQLEYTRWNGASWTPQVDIGLVWYGYALRSALAVDPVGRLQMIYKGWGTPERPLAGRTVQDLWHTSADATKAEAAYAWTTPTQISSGNPGYFSDVAVDSRGIIHVIWTEGDTKGVYGLFYTRSIDGGATWSHRIILSGDEPTWWYRAHLKIDTQDHLYVTWEAMAADGSANALPFGVTHKAVYEQSVDGGATWTSYDFTDPPPTVPQSDVTPGPQQPVSGVDGRGTILFIYREFGTDRILYRQSADGLRWSAAEPIPGIAHGVARPYDVYDTATDSDGHVHLVMIGYAKGSSVMSVLHSEWDGQSWTTPEVIASPPPFPEYPRIAIGEGNRLHVVWFGGDNASTNRTPVGIWYSNATSAAPTLMAQAPSSGALPLMQGQSGDPTRIRATANPTSKVVPTIQALAPADRVVTDPAQVNPGALLRQPVLPTAAAVILSCLLLAAIVFGPWSADIVRRRYRGQ